MPIYLFILSLWTFELFPVLYKKAAMNMSICVHVFFDETPTLQDSGVEMLGHREEYVYLR